MSKAKYLLSICIPTYNRAEVLGQCIEAIVHHEFAKTGSIEIVVCDNASTDGTEALMQKYKDVDYVKYYRNKENVGVIYNTIIALDHAQGEFLKLINDHSIYTPDGLQYLYEQVKANMEERPVLLFRNDGWGVPTEKVCYTMDETVRQTGYNLTWMGVYGYWKEDWENMQDREAYYDKTFITIDYLRQMFERKKKAIVYRAHYVEMGGMKRTQGGYNFFDVFILQYLNIWNEYVERNIITSDTYKWIKKDLWEFAFGYTKQLLIFNKSGNFDVKNGWKILFEHYGKEWYFYATWMCYPFNVIKRKIARRKNK